MFILFAAMQLNAADLKLLKETKIKAEKGNSEAQYTLGQWFADGAQFVSEGRDFYLSKDLEQARKWFELASAQGYDEAKTRLLEVEQIEAKQNSLFQNTKAKAEMGDQESQIALGDMYCKGDCVSPDLREAVNWYRKAAKQGNLKAEYNLGAIYAPFDRTLVQSAMEDAIMKNWAQSVILTSNTNVESDWFNETLQSSVAAGYNVPVNYAEAANWYRAAAEQGQADAQRNLGVMYGKGDGVPQDYVEAYKWFNLAAAQGDADAAENRNYIIGFMTGEQVAEAQHSSAAFIPKSASNFVNSNPSQSPRIIGTAFFITDDGYLISNYHVVKDATRIRLVTNVRTIDAKIVTIDAANDLALLKVEGTFSPLPIAASRTVNLGGTVATVGFPDIGLQGFAPKLAKGEIASLTGAGDDPRYFQISVPVQPGNSGGALVDEKGNVVGIVSAKLDASAAFAATGSLPENVNYAIKSSLLLSFLESVPDVDAKLKAPNTMNENFEDVVQSAQGAAVLVLGY